MQDLVVIQSVIINNSISLDDLDKLLKQNQNLLDSIYQRDIFIKSAISKLIEQYPDLWKLYNILNGELTWLANLLGLAIQSDDINVDNPLLNSTIKNVEKSKSTPSCKNLYRKICRLTHPDKIKNIKLNNYFIVAKILYKTQDYEGLQDLYELVLAEINNITYESLQKRVNKLKDEINRNKVLFDSLGNSEDFQIATKFYNITTKLEAEQMFISKINLINNNLISQINEIKVKIYGVKLNA
jgi:hypothetical protein